MLDRLRPYGPVRPARWGRSHLKAWVLGIRDGWTQPHELSTSTNVDHLWVNGSDVHYSLDAGANLGQWLRSPLNHQRVEF